MSYFTEFEQAFLRFLKSQITEKVNAFIHMSDTQKDAILKAFSFADICTISDNTDSTFPNILVLAKQVIQYQSQSNEAFITLLLEIEQNYHIKNQKHSIYKKTPHEEVQAHIHGLIHSFLKEISLSNDLAISLKRSIDARFFLRENVDQKQYTFQHVIDERIRNKTFGWGLYETLVMLSDTYNSELKRMPASRFKEDNERYLASIQHSMTPAGKAMQELLLLVQANKLDSDLVFAVGKSYYLDCEFNEYRRMTRKAAEMGNEFAQLELVTNILLWDLKVKKPIPAENLAEATPILQKLTQSQNKWTAATAIDFMQRHHKVFAASVATPQSAAPFCLDSLRTVTASTTAPSVTSETSSSSSRKLPSHQVATNLSLKRR